MKTASIATALALGAGQGAASTVPPDPLVLEAFLPDLAAATFVPHAPITNAYFPVDPRVVRTYEGVEEDDGELVTIRSVQRYAGAGPELLGIKTTAVSDIETVDGILMEETLDYFAQDGEGNVWYFGEDVTNYRYDEDGNFLATDSASAWLAGVNGALPGFIMPAVLPINFNFYQEYAPADAALDEGTILATDATVTIGLGTFEDVLVVLETSVLDPVLELNYYARGIGQILTEEDVDKNYENPEVSVPLVAVSQVPLPAGLPLLAAGIGLLALFRRPGRTGQAHAACSGRR